MTFTEGLMESTKILDSWVCTKTKVFVVMHFYDPTLPGGYLIELQQELAVVVSNGWEEQDLNEYRFLMLPWCRNIGILGQLIDKQDARIMNSQIWIIIVLKIVVIFSPIWNFGWGLPEGSWTSKIFDWKWSVRGVCFLIHSI